MSARVERNYPTVVGVVVGAGFLLLRHSHPLPQHWPDLLVASISVAAIAVGFFAAAKATVISSDAGNDRPLIAQLKQAGVYHDFLSYLNAAINWSFAAAALSAGFLLINFNSSTWVHSILFAVWILVAVVAGASYYRAVRVLTALERNS